MPLKSFCQPIALALISLILVLTSCEETDIPYVETIKVTEISTSSALCMGEVHCNGNARILEKGVCWGINPNPLKDDNHIIDGDKEGLIEIRISELEESQKYYARAYASNRQYTGYGEVIEFTTGETIPNPEIPDNFTDVRDGNQYKIVKIGEQWWMAENLAYIPSVSPSTVASYDKPVYYVYGYEGTEVTEAKQSEAYLEYGALYNWEAAMNGEESSDLNPGNVQGVCPTGWHLPSDSEWKQLELYLGMSEDVVDEEQGRGYQAMWLKEAGNKHWFVPNPSDNAMKFTALPGGRSLINRFDAQGAYGFYRSSTETSTTTSWTRCFGYNSSNIYRGRYSKSEGQSVRCVKD